VPHAFVRVLELLRRAIRGVLPRALYSGLASGVDYGYAIRNMGVRNFLHLRRLLPPPQLPSSEPVQVRVRGIRYPILVRPGTTDPGELIHTCVREVYGKFLPSGEVRLIIDAGANIGSTTVWYLNRFPEATVIAVEPDENNFRLLEENCRPYGSRAIPIQAAVWPRDGETLRIIESDSANSISVGTGMPNGAGGCPSISMNGLLALTEYRTIDIFKCDIEGAELDLFGSGSDQWLPSVRSIAIEIHSPECQLAVSSATAGLGFSHLRYREIHVLQR
jgi:FkbM family methyltransferase